MRKYKVMFPNHYQWRHSAVLWVCISTTLDTLVVDSIV